MAEPSEDKNVGAPGPGSPQHVLSADPFKLIEKGNGMEAANNWWSAADAFGEASLVLRNQSDGMVLEVDRERREAQEENNSVDLPATVLASLMERVKIAELYDQQSREYLYKARDCLLQALQFENGEDRRRAQEASSVAPPPSAAASEEERRALRSLFEPLIMMLDPEEAARRSAIFNRIFTPEKPEPPQQVAADHQLDAEEIEEQRPEEIKEDSGYPAQANKDSDCRELLHPREQGPQPSSQESQQPAFDLPEAPVGTGKKEEQNQDIEKKQRSLEDRLADLSELDLPEEPFANSHRPIKNVEDIHAGLKRLGVSMPPPAEPFRPDEPPPSEEDQVLDIIQQAKDEVRFSDATADGDHDNIDVAAYAGTDTGADVTFDGGEKDDELPDLIAKVKRSIGELDGPQGQSDSADDVGGLISAVKQELEEKGSLLVLLNSAQDLLLQAAELIEDGDMQDEDTGDIPKEDGDGGDDEDADEAAVGGPALDEDVEEVEEADRKTSNSMKKAKSSVLGAKVCIEKIINGWPKEK